MQTITLTITNVDRLPDGGIGFIAGAEQIDGVAGDEAAFRHPVAQGFQRAKPVAVGLGDHRRFDVETFEGGTAGFCLDQVMLQDRGTADSVDAGDQVDRRAHQRRQDDDADPADGGADILLRHGGVNGAKRAGHQRNRGQDMRPIMGERVEHGEDIEHFPEKWIPIFRPEMQ